MSQKLLTPAEQTPVLAHLQAAGIPAETSGRRLAEYSYDASNYRLSPVAVVFPRTVQDVVATLAACRETATPLVSRGGGTSMAGNAIGPGIVLDFSRHMNRIISIDPDMNQPELRTTNSRKLNALSRPDQIEVIQKHDQDPTRRATRHYACTAAPQQPRLGLERANARRKRHNR